MRRTMAPTIHRDVCLRSLNGKRERKEEIAITTMQASPRVLLDGLTMVESPRWHDGRLWFPNWGTPEIIAVDLEGNAEVMAEGPSGLGQSIGWLPDGRMLVTGDELTRYEPDGTTVRHADLSHITDAVWSEMTIDGRGNIYVNSIGFDFSEMAERVMDPSNDPTGVIALITPDGTARKVADQIAFPNGMVITPDNETLIVSESFTGTLLAFDIAPDGSLSGRRPWADRSGSRRDLPRRRWGDLDIDARQRVRAGGRRRGDPRQDPTRPCLLRHDARRTRRPNPLHDGERVHGSGQLRRDARETKRPGADRRSAGTPRRVAVT